jgi:hypothetical protein
MLNPLKALAGVADVVAQSLGAGSRSVAQHSEGMLARLGDEVGVRSTKATNLAVADARATQAGHGAEALFTDPRASTNAHVVRAAAQTNGLFPGATNDAFIGLMNHHGIDALHATAPEIGATARMVADASRTVAARAANELDPVK